MEIQCDCGKFRVELVSFPQNTPGRLKCYCDDCQAFLRYLKREDLLDQNGGSEIIPAYPADMKMISGRELMTCTKLSPTGMFRFSTTCCNTPIANTDPKRAWAGVHGRMHSAKDPNRLDKIFGPVKYSIMGKYAKGTPPKGTPQKLDFKGMVAVLPFILKGQFLGRAKPSPFFDDGADIVPTKTLTPEERAKI